MKDHPLAERFVVAMESLARSLSIIAAVQPAPELCPECSSPDLDEVVEEETTTADALICNACGHTWIVADDEPSESDEKADEHYH